MSTTIWNLLRRVQSLQLNATTRNRNSFFYRAAAVGRVNATASGHHVLTFREAGKWVSLAGQAVDFHNSYRWSLVDRKDVIGLEHLRHGPDNPVHLVDFAADASGGMRSVEPHRCGDDRYSAWLWQAGNGVHLRWKIEGPAKDDILNCLYLTDFKPQP